MAVSIEFKNSINRGSSRGPLSRCKAGDYVEVLSIDSALGCAARLRELCLLEGQFIRVVRRSDPLLLDLRGSLLAIDLETAALIEVRDAQCA